MLALFDSFETAPVRGYMSEHWFIPVLYTAAYLSLIVLGQRVMRSRQAWDVTKANIAWHALVVAKSLVFSYYMLPRLLATFGAEGLEYTVCPPIGEGSFSDGRVGLATLAYVLSRPMFFFETLLLVLSKRPVPFLHVFHHSAMSLTAWAGFVFNADIGVAWCYTMNAITLSYCHLYWGLDKVFKLFGVARSLWWMKVTLLMMLVPEMMWGFTLSSLSLWVYPECSTSTSVVTRLGVVMYGVFVPMYAQQLLACFAANQPLGEKQVTAPRRRWLRMLSSLMNKAH